MDLYLPKVVNGVPVLAELGEGMFQADNAFLKATVRAIAYRNSKNMADKETEHPGLNWDDTTRGVDEGDGWIKVTMKEDAFEKDLAEFKKEFLARQAEQKRQKLNTENAKPDGVENGKPNAVEPAKSGAVDIFDEEEGKKPALLQTEADEEEKRQQMRERRQKKKAEQMEQEEAAKRQQMRERRQKTMQTTTQTDVDIICDD